VTEQRGYGRGAAGTSDPDDTIKDPVTVPPDPLAALDAWRDPAHSSELGQLHVVGALELLKQLPDDCLDLTVTSPPYERQPKYGNGEKYEREWFQTTFLEITKELLRATKPTGQFVLNFRSRRMGAERSTLQFELVAWLKEQGWLFAEDHVWVKPSPPPGKFRQATKDAIEYCFRFAKTDAFELYPDQCLSPARWDAKDRERRKKHAHNFERVNAVGGQGRKRVQAGPDWVAPSNALVVEPEFSPNPAKHPARFPPALPEFFIKLCSKPGDVVYDPFAGTATTAVVAECLERRWICSELDADYAAVLPARLDDLARRMANAPTPVEAPEGVRVVPLPFALPAPKAVKLRGRPRADQAGDRFDAEQVGEVGSREDEATAVPDDRAEGVG
jgi:site-specific DNA-methyltransferase (adenine-specific)